MSAEALLGAAPRRAVSADEGRAAPDAADAELRLALTGAGESRSADSADEPDHSPDTPDALDDVPKSLTEEVGKILRVTWPQIVVIVCRIATSFTDTAVVGKLGTDELAGTAFASIIIQVTGILIWSGVGDTMITLTSQAHGAQNHELASAWLQIGCLMSLVLSLPVGLVWWYCGEILRSIGQVQAAEPGVIHWASVFGRMSTLWLIPDSLSCAYCQWVTGLEKVRDTVPIYVVCVLLNLLLNIVLVYGVSVGGRQLFTGMGLYGSPIATTIMTTGRLVALVLYMRPRLPPVRWSLGNITRERTKTFMSQGIPNALSSLFEQAQLVVMTFMVAQFGKDALGAHSAMMNCFDMATAVIYGTMEGGSMAVAKELGAGRPESAKTLAKYLLATMFCFGALISAVFLSARNYIGYIFSSEPQVIHDMAQISVLIGVVYIFVCVTLASFSVIQGQARAEEAVVCFFVGLWIVGTPAAYLIAFPLKQGFLGVWEGCVLGYFTMTILLAALVLRSDWTKLSEEARVRSEVKPLIIRRASSTLSRSPSLRVASASPT